MVKEVISTDELLNKIKAVVINCSECSNIHIDSIQTYPQEVDGANWAINNIRCSGPDNDVEECENAIKASITALHAKYNVSI